jgi:hypothetical protein
LLEQVESAVLLGQAPQEMEVISAQQALFLLVAAAAEEIHLAV